MLIIDYVDLRKIEHNGRAVMLVYGDGDHAHAAVCRLYAAATGTAVPEQGTAVPYFTGWQAIAGCRPAVGERWRLADGRRIVVTGHNAGGGVICEIDGRAVVLALRDFDGARPGEVEPELWRAYEILLDAAERGGNE
jgi:hypothetical protein